MFLTLATLVVGLLVAAGLITARAGVIGAAGQYLPWSSPDVSCTTTDVEVVVAPQIFDVARGVLLPLNGRTLDDGSCLRVDIESESPIITAQEATSTATSQLPQLWIPDSSLWAAQATAWPLQAVGSVATTPIVLAASPAGRAGLGWRNHRIPWSRALDATDHALAAPSMINDASSLLGLLAMARTLGPGTRTEQRVAATILAASRQGAP